VISEKIKPCVSGKKRKEKVKEIVIIDAIC
jgi:hypothetical protein